MDAVEQSLNREPAFPQGFPASGPVRAASQVAPIAGDGGPTTLGAQLSDWHVGQGGGDLHEVGRQDPASRLLGGAAAPPPAAATAAPLLAPTGPASGTSPHSSAGGAVPLDSLF